MSWSFAEMIAYASRGSNVAAGDVLGSGTCGTGCLAELWGWAGEQIPAPLAIGDVIRMEIEGIGSIENKLVKGVAANPVSPAIRHPDIRME
jgi:2-keto-4-pentenoate hydratase/2-oxohepta-3-ene-1,7-dioic acid hydratase in catechol pathway